MIADELQFLNGEIRIVGTSVHQSTFRISDGWSIRVEGNAVYLSAPAGAENGWPRPEVPEFSVVGAPFSFRKVVEKSPPIEVATDKKSRRNQ